jgi:uncharacterized RDD family membrane protein YckC
VTQPELRGTPATTPPAPVSVPPPAAALSPPAPVSVPPPAAAAAPATGADVCAGLVTRTVAFAADAAIITLVAATVGVVVGLGVSALHLPEQANALIATALGGLGFIWSVAYFVFFWSSTGQTPGDRLMAIAVLDSGRRRPLTPRRAVLRFGALWLALIPLGAGIFIMLWDRRSRCLQDHLARTIVVHVAQGP